MRREINIMYEKKENKKSSNKDNDHPSKDGLYETCEEIIITPDFERDEEYYTGEEQ
jgi:hypothetical protein